MSTILIVYERELEQQAVQKLLAGSSHTILVTANGIDALELARRSPPDAIVSDFLLPKMDGFALCRKCKQDERLQDVPFIFYTSRRDDPKYERFALEVGADRFLARVADSATVLKAVEEHLAQRAARDALRRATPHVPEAWPQNKAQVAPSAPGETDAQIAAQASAKIADQVASQVSAQVSEQVSAHRAQVSARTAQVLADQEKLKARIVELEISNQQLSTDEQAARQSLVEWQELVRSNAQEHAQAIQQHQLALRSVEEVQQCLREQTEKCAQEELQHRLTRKSLDELQADAQRRAQEQAHEISQHQQAESLLLGNLQRAEVALQAIIETLVAVSERHDPHTAGSAQRVAALATTIGRELGLDGERQHALRIAGLLHDVGMITVPAEILGRPHDLVPAERALMQTHAAAGWALLRPIAFGVPVADIVHQHHERHDGGGYPRALKGENILLEARILAVADAVDAMCSTRPMRTALGLERALDEIEKNSGSQFDPKVAAACVRLFRQHGYQWTSQAAA
jgi:response regulator RpfG family c-di-GMP phosphodiesterase